MRLSDAVKTIERMPNAEGHTHYILSLELGEHGWCDLESNCPLAIKIRDWMRQMDITLLDILDAYEEQDRILNEEYDQMYGIEEANLSGTMRLNINGHVVEQDISDILSNAARSAISRKWDEIRNIERQLKEFASGLYRTHIEEVKKIRRNVILPQLYIDPYYAVKHNILVTEKKHQNGIAYYDIYIPFHYQPESIIKSGIRFGIPEVVVEDIKRDVLLNLWVNATGQITKAMLVNYDLTKFHHYHSQSSGNDCWGMVILRFDDDTATAQHIVYLRNELQGALGTINYDSLGRRDPAGMPHAETLMNQCETLGEEGVLGEQVITLGAEGWGGGRGWNVNDGEEEETGNNGEPLRAEINEDRLAWLVEEMANEEDEEDRVTAEEEL